MTDIKRLDDADMKVALENAKAQVNALFSLEAVEKARERILAELEDRMKKHLDDVEALQKMMPDGFSGFLERGGFLHRSMVFASVEELSLRVFGRELMSLPGGQRWSLPHGRLWRMIFMACPVPSGDFTKEEQRDILTSSFPAKW